MKTHKIITNIAVIFMILIVLLLIYIVNGNSLITKYSFVMTALTFSLMLMIWKR